MAKTSNTPVDETAKVETTTEAAVTETALETTETATTEDVVTETVPEVTETETTEATVIETAPEGTETTTTEDVVTEIVPEGTEATTTEDVVTETVPEVTETETTEDVVTETVTEAEEKVDPDFQTEAETLMASQNVKEIWRCPIKGYWFTKAENALDHSKKVDKSPEHYKL
jgi:rubrerythrin